MKAENNKKNKKNNKCKKPTVRGSLFELFSDLELELHSLQGRRSFDGPNAVVLRNLKQTTLQIICNIGKYPHSNTKPYVMVSLSNVYAEISRQS